MAVYDKAGIKAQGNALYPDNTNEEIAPIDLRAMNDNYADSFTFAAADTTISGNWSFSANVSIPSTPTATTHATSKGYVDNLLDGLKFKSDAMVVATTGNITLSGEQTIDGTLTSASRVLVWQQTDQTENGLYLSDAGAWARTTDGSTGTELVSAVVIIREGSTYADKEFVCTNNSITLGVTNITWVLRASTTSHNNLSGLQGGTSSEYYHLTSAEYTGLVSKSVAETISGAWTFSDDLTLSGTGAIKVPEGTTAQRPTPAEGMLRKNSTTSKIEGYEAGAWKNMITGASGATITDKQVCYSDSSGNIIGSAKMTFTTGFQATLALLDTVNPLFKCDIDGTTSAGALGGLTLSNGSGNNGALFITQVGNLSNFLGVTEANAIKLYGYTTKLMIGTSGAEPIQIGTNDTLALEIDETTQDFDFQANNLTTTGTVTAGAISLGNAGTINNYSGTDTASSSNPYTLDVITSGNIGNLSTYLCMVTQNAGTSSQSVFVTTSGAGVITIVELSNSGSSILSWVDNSGALAIQKTTAATPSYNWTIIKLR